MCAETTNEGDKSDGCSKNTTLYMQQVLFSLSCVSADV